MAGYVGQQIEKQYLADSYIGTNTPQSPTEIRIALDEIRIKLERIKGNILPDLSLKLSSVLPQTVSEAQAKEPPKNGVTKLGNELFEIDRELNDIIGVLVYFNDTICL